MNAQANVPVVYIEPHSNGGATHRRLGRTPTPIHFPKRPFKVKELAEKIKLSAPAVYARVKSAIAHNQLQLIRFEKVRGTKGKATAVYKQTGFPS